jgi:ABC-2 type transport system ATP-binding protein
MIEIDGLTKRYGHKTAVDRLSFVVEPGVVTGFLGPNGAGKSTTNSEIAASLFLSEGTVKIHVGRILSKLGLRDRVRAVVLAYESRLITPGTPPPDRPAHT